MPRAPANFDRSAQALGINVGEILNDYGIYAMFHELLREAGELCTTVVVLAASGTVHTIIYNFTTATTPGIGWLCPETSRMLGLLQCEICLC